MCIDVSWIATSNTHQCPLKERNYRECSGRGKIQGKEEKSKSDGGPVHACVKRLCYECDEVIDGKFLCGKGHTPLDPIFYFSCQLLRHPKTKWLSCFFFRIPTRIKWPLGVYHTVCNLYEKHPSVPQLSYSAWSTAQQEWICVCACIRGGMFPFPLCLKHMDWVGMWGRRRQQREGEGRVKGGNLRGVSHSAGQHMVYTLHTLYSESDTDRKDFPFNFWLS